MPRRISGRLTLNVEDIAAIGQANFESALRDNLSMVLSDQYDRQCVRGNGVGAERERAGQSVDRPERPDRGGDVRCIPGRVQ